MGDESQKATKILFHDLSSMLVVAYSDASVDIWEVLFSPFYQRSNFIPSPNSHDIFKFFSSFLTR